MTDDIRINILNARADAVNYITSGAKPSLKVISWLINKGYSESVALSVVDELKDEGRINDRALADKIIRKRSGKRLEMSDVLLARLEHAQIPVDIAMDAVSAIFGSDRDIVAEADELLLLKFGSFISTMHEWNEANAAKVTNRMLRFLAARGFDQDTCLEALARFIKRQDIGE